MTSTQALARVAVLGGAFDPPHLAHRSLLTSALDQLGLDRVIVMPTGQAWHKSRPLSPAHHRLAMARLAFGDLARVQIDPRETLRDGPTYTIDTLRELRREQPNTALYVLMGADQASALTTWRAWQEILQIAVLGIADRKIGGPAGAPYGFERAYADRVRHLLMPALDISATDIRQRISAGETPGASVHPDVARYIADHHLYQTT